MHLMTLHEHVLSLRSPTTPITDIRLFILPLLHSWFGLVLSDLTFGFGC